MQKTDTLFTNAFILTMDEKLTQYFPGAVAVRGDRIIAVGPEEEIKKEYISDLKFHYVTDMEQVLKLALLKEKVKNPLNISMQDNEKKS